MGDGGARAPSEVGGPGSWGARESRRRVQPLHPRVYKATWRNHGRSGAVQTWAHGKGSEQGERSASSGFPENTRFFSVTSGAPEFPVSLLPPPSPSPLKCQRGVPTTCGDPRLGPICSGLCGEGGGAADFLTSGFTLPFSSSRHRKQPRLSKRSRRGWVPVGRGGSRMQAHALGMLPHPPPWDNLAALPLPPGILHPPQGTERKPRVSPRARG